MFSDQRDSSQAKLWEVNVGHWGSYVSFDLQLSNGVHSQVRGAEATLPQPEKRDILSLASTVRFNLITLSSRLHLHGRCECVILPSVLSASITCVCVRVSCARASKSVPGLSLRAVTS